MWFERHKEKKLKITKQNRHTHLLPVDPHPKRLQQSGVGRAEIRTWKLSAVLPWGGQRLRAWALTPCFPGGCTETGSGGRACTPCGEMWCCACALTGSWGASHAVYWFCPMILSSDFSHTHALLTEHVPFCRTHQGVIHHPRIHSMQYSWELKSQDFLKTHHLAHESTAIFFLATIICTFLHQDLFFSLPNVSFIFLLYLERLPVS